MGVADVVDVGDGDDDGNDNDQDADVVFHVGAASVIMCVPVDAIVLVCVCR